MKRLTYVLIIIVIVGSIILPGCSTHKMTVGGQSMVPTLSNGAKVNVDKKAYSSSEPKRSDIIAFYDVSNTVIIKRVIALPGENLEILDGKVYIDGSILNEDYLNSQDSTEPASDTTSWIVSENSVFLMGDNRTSSKDSRIFGCIPYNKIIGKVIN